MAYRSFEDVLPEQPPYLAKPKRVHRSSLWFPGDPPPAPIRWVVDGLIQRGGLTVIAGPPGSGKSVAALSALLANGKLWLGRHVEGGPALWLAYEAADSTCRRAAALDPNAQACFERSPPNLLDRGAFSDLNDILNEAKVGFSRPVEIVIVDALASAMRGGDENSGRDVGAALGILLKLIEQHDLTVIVIAHTGKGDDSGPRGHSSISADATSVLSIGGSSTIRRLRTRKQRDAEPLPAIPFRVTERNGALDVSLAEDGGAEAPRRNRVGPDAKAVLSVIEQSGPAPWKTLRDDLCDTMQSVKKRSPGAIRKALSTLKSKLADMDLISFDEDIVTVTERYRSVTSNAQANTASVTAKRYRSPPIRGDGNVGNAPTRRAANRVAR